MSKDTPNKQKNIDDVLLSIDSLLDTATDIQLDDPDVRPVEPQVNKTSDDTKQTTAAKTDKPKRSTPKPKSEAKSKLGSKTKPAAGKKPSPDTPADKPRARKSKSATADKESSNLPSGPTEKAVDAAATDRPLNPQQPAKDKQSVANKINIQKENKDSAVTQKLGDKEPVRNINPEDDPSKSLNFVTVDDDLSQAMRELPVLEDIVTAEDLALIGSGKEPPKKILTEAFKKLSLTDKLIEILENQLSDYNISKLEYKYLHELFDELLDKEKDRK